MGEEPFLVPTTLMRRFAEAAVEALICEKEQPANKKYMRWTCSLDEPTLTYDPSRTTLMF